MLLASSGLLKSCEKRQLIFGLTDLMYTKNLHS